MLVSYVSQPRNSNLKLKFPILHRISKPFFWWPDPSLCPQRLSVRLSPGGFSCNVLQSQMWVQPATGHRPALIYGRECPLPRATLQSFSSLDFTALRSEISYTICTFFLHEEKKKANDMEICSYPILTITGCHPAALISALSSAFWGLLPDSSAPCHCFLLRGLPSDSVFLTIIHKPHTSLTIKNIYINR